MKKEHTNTVKGVLTIRRRKPNQYSVDIHEQMILYLLFIYKLDYKCASSGFLFLNV